MRFRSCVFAGAWPPARWRWIRSGVRRGERWGGSFSRSPRAGQRALARLIFVERAVLVLGPECGPDLLLNVWTLVVPRAASQPQSRARQTAPFSGPLPSDSRAALGVASSRVGAQAVATTEDSNLADQGRPRGEGQGSLPWRAVGRRGVRLPERLRAPLANFAIGARPVAER